MFTDFEIILLEFFVLAFRIGGLEILVLLFVGTLYLRAGNFQSIVDDPASAHRDMISARRQHEQSGARDGKPLPKAALKNFMIQKFFKFLIHACTSFAFSAHGLHLLKIAESRVNKNESTYMTVVAINPPVKV